MLASVARDTQSGGHFLFFKPQLHPRGFYLVWALSRENQSRGSRTNVRVSISTVRDGALPLPLSCPVLSCPVRCCSFGA